jgi:hypothetical protein
LPDARWHEGERDELSRIDYFLDQLARAVERGEVPIESYEALAPRYLDRRADLVAILTGRTSQSASAVTPQPAPQPAPQPVPQSALRPAPASRPRPVAPPPKPVEWTTVLLFVGAFLVIAATAVFSFWAWERVGPGTKLFALVAVTAGFYAAGWYTRSKLDLQVGSGALTVVASAMLLFDWWILIDGFHLPPAMSWSFALLVTSVVYWASEVLLGKRYYGIAGAAAQVGWWWLMTSGLHFEDAWRLAGLGIIALVWQLTAERARDSEAFGPLAVILEWAAPAVQVLAALAFIATTVLIGNSSMNLAVCGLILALGGAVVLVRTRHIPDRARFWIAGALQIPFFIVLVMPGKATWMGAGLLAAVTVAYTLYALLRAGTPFAIPAFLAELITAGSVLSLLSASDRDSVVVFAWLAVSWVVAARLAEMMADRPGFERLHAARSVSRVGHVMGFGLLAITSLMTPLAGSGVPLTGVPIVSQDVVMAALVLAAWAAASLARRRAEFAAGAMFWSFFPLAALLAWGAPQLHSATYATLLLALVAVWLAIRRPLERFYRLPERFTLWTMHALALLIVAVGLAAELFFFDSATTTQAMGLVTAAIVVFLADADYADSVVSALVAGLLSVLAAFLAIGNLADHVALIAVVLAAWAAASLIRRRPWFAVGAVVWSFFTLSAVLAWSLPELHSASDATALILLAGVWLAARRFLGRFYGVSEQVTAWMMRAFALLFVTGGLVLEVLDHGLPMTWQGVGLAVAAAVFFFADAIFDGAEVSAGLASALTVLAVYLTGHRDGVTPGQLALAIGGASAVLGVAGAVLRDIWPRRAVWLAAAAPVMALSFFSAAAGSTWAFAGGVLLWALAVAAAGVASREEFATLIVGFAVLFAVGVGLSVVAPAWPVTVAAFAVASIVFGALTLLPALSPEGPLRASGAWLVLSGAAGLLWLVVCGLSLAPTFLFGSLEGWTHLGLQGLAISLLLLGVYVVVHAVRWRVEPMEYVGWGALLLGVLAQLRASEFTGVELYTTPVALYAAGMGYLYAWRHPERGVPIALDASTVLVGLGTPVLRTLMGIEGDVFTHLAWAVGLSIIAIVAGIGLRVRWYFFGGITAIVVATGWRTIIYLAGVWWVILGVVGVAAIIVALTWERQRALLSGTAAWTQGWR